MAKITAEQFDKSINKIIEYTNQLYKATLNKSIENKAAIRDVIGSMRQELMLLSQMNTKRTMKLGDMTVNLRKRICEKRANCTDCPFRTTDYNLCDPKYWSMFPEAEIELDEEDLK